MLRLRVGHWDHGGKMVIVPTTLACHAIINTPGLMVVGEVEIVLYWMSRVAHGHDRLVAISVYQMHL